MTFKKKKLKGSLPKSADSRSLVKGRNKAED